MGKGPVQFSPVQFSCSVVSDSLRPHELQQARPPCPSPSPGVYSNSCPSSRWCHPAISSSVAPSPPAPSPPKHQGLFQWLNSSQEVAKVLEFQLHWGWFGKRSCNSLQILSDLLEEEGLGLLYAVSEGWTIINKLMILVQSKKNLWRMRTVWHETNALWGGEPLSGDFQAQVELLIGNVGEKGLHTWQQQKQI